MQYQNIRALLEDERFLNYCLKKNPEDVHYWEQWLIANPDRRDEINGLKAMVLLLGNSLSAQEAENQFAKLDYRISGGNTIFRLRWFNLFTKYAVAASLMLILGAGLFFRNDRHSNNEHLSKVSVKDITPGSNKAMLTLANGTKINLNQVSNGQLASESGVNIVKTANGQLVYDLSGATGQASEVGYNTIEVPAGGQWQIILPDQTKVWLNAQSSITYPTKFAGNVRRVKITGEAYFEVAHHKKLPFRVESGAQLVEVLGTHFNIMAYADDRLIKTTLLEGSVKVVNKGQSQLLKPGQQAQVNARGIVLSDDVDIEEAVAWKNGDFQFNENLEGIMTKIARWYDVEIVYQVKPDADLTFSGKISRSRNLSAILKMLEYNGDVHFKIEGRRVTVIN
ncbi:FecR family protein [Pedobacter psychrodurus]|uniref:FecR family protein n=1 Tax=Pedobacter psychrodurus TaxID=2530456 RepID=UPI0029316CE2|nr:FecR domain-containing protein [Pedobacter psychrodurus]